MPLIDVRGVSAQYRGRDGTAIRVLDEVSFSVEAGELCVVLGPNGAGKSTLVRVISGALRPFTGTVELLGSDVGSLDRAAIARQVAVVPQTSEVALGFSVHEVVMMGRAPHQGAWMHPRPEDEAAVDRALRACELEDLATRPITELSGGEQKRVAIARALAQEARVLLLDEVGAHLDVHHLIATHELVRREIEERKLACIAVVHDLNLAAQYADRVVLLRAGKLVAHGSVEEVMTYRRLSDVFSAELYVGVNELDGARYFLPVRPRSRPQRPRDL